LPNVAFQVFRDTVYLGDKSTDTNGEIVMKNVDPGTYQFVEKNPLPGYEDNPETHTIQVTADTDVEFTISNRIRKKVTLLKKDEKTNDPIEGVLFHVTLNGQQLPDYTTDAKGEIVIDHAPPGTYRFVEFRTHPDYVPDDTPHEIEHTLDQDSVLTVYNTHRPGLTVKKRDSVTGQPLKGAQFKITYSATGSGSTSDLGTFFTEEDGEISFSTENGNQLKEGWYTIGYVIIGLN